MASISNSTPTFRGVGVHWGVGSTSVTAFGTFKLQSTDHQLQSDTEIVKDGTGYDVAKIYYNANETATFECVITGTNGIGTVTPTLAEPGDMITVDDNVYPQIASTKWLVESTSIRRSNTSSMRVTYSLTQYPLITS